MDTKLKLISDYIEMEKNSLDSLDKNQIKAVIDLFLSAYKRNGTIYVMGNGGSASTASHMANDFNKGISEYLDRKFNVVSLADNIPTILAIANDISYDQIFKFQVQGKLKKNDIVVGISGSGNSQNILNAILYAKEQHIKTIGIVGFNGGKLKEMVDVCYHVKLNNMQVVEDLHMGLNHLMMNVILKLLNVATPHSN